MEGFQKDETNRNGKENVELSVQTAVGVDMFDVEEITDSRGEELTDKEIINMEISKVIKNMKPRHRKNYKSFRNCSQRNERT
jgi:hypothetical protein